MLKRYTKTDTTSYTLGVFPTIELLTYKPEQVLQVIIHPAAQKSSGIATILQLCENHKIQVSFDSKVFAKLSPKENVFACGVFKKYTSQLEPNQTTVVLLNPTNAGNLGTIMRTMLGFGIVNLALTTPCVDNFSPETIRAAMGACFKLNFELFDSLPAATEKINLPTYYFDASGTKLSPTTQVPQPAALIFGNEPAGIKPQLLVDQKVYKIPMTPEIDSYNLAISVGIVLYVVTTSKSETL